MKLRDRLASSPPARLVVFGVVLGLALGGGALVGASVGPEPPRRPDHADVTVPGENGHDGHGGDRDE